MFQTTNQKCIYIYIIYKPPYYLRGASPRRPGGNSPCASVRRWSWSAASGWAPAWPCGWPRPGWWNVGKKVGKSRKNPRNPWENVETPRNVENTLKYWNMIDFWCFFSVGDVCFWWIFDWFLLGVWNFSRSLGWCCHIRRRGLLQAGAKVVLWSALTGTTTMGHLHMPRASAGKIDLLIYLWTIPGYTPVQLK